MSKTLIGVFTLFFLLACGRSGLRRDQKSYDVIQEGSANGVTSTIQGPGESLPPITGTNADTTTAFSIDPKSAAASPAPEETIAGTLPRPATEGTVAAVPSTTGPVNGAQRAALPRAAAERPAAQQQPGSQPQAEPQLPPPAETETAVEPQPPGPEQSPPTDTATPPTSTDTASAPEEKKPPEEEEPPPPPPPPPRRG